MFRVRKIRWFVQYVKIQNKCFLAICYCGYCCHCYERTTDHVGHIAKTGSYNCLHFLLLSSSLKARSNVISYVTVNDSPDSDSSLSSPYSTDTLSALRGNNSGSLLEGPGRTATDGTGTRTIIVPPLKTQLGDCTVATQTSGKKGLSC